MDRKRFPNILAAAIFSAFCALNNSNFAQTKTNPTPTPEATCVRLSPAYEECALPTNDEQQVLDQIMSGRPANLTNKPVLRGCFIRDLLTKKVGVPQIGIVIDGAIIRGAVDIRNEEIPNRVEVTHCIFEDDFNMSRSHLTKGVSLAGSSFGSKFHGRLDAEFATVDFDFILDDCTFENCYTFFDGIHVGKDWFLRRALFDGKVNFTGAVVAGSIFADTEASESRHTEFHDETDFEFVKVDQDCRLNNVAFGGFVGFGSGEFSTLQITGATFNGNVTFRSTTIDSFYLTDAKNFRGLLTIEDMKFKYMSPQDWEKLEQIAEQSNNDNKSNNAQFYGSLENQFRVHGQSSQADEVYVAWRRKERKGLPLFWKVIDYAQDWFVGYGRHPERAVFLVILVIAIGNIVFRREDYMQTKKKDDQTFYTNKYNALSYSVDLLMPVIGLGVADIWTPKGKVRIWYTYIHRIIGYLLVSIIVAAWAIRH